MLGQIIKYSIKYSLVLKNIPWLIGCIAISLGFIVATVIILNLIEQRRGRR
jgi:hypothetical protein